MHLLASASANNVGVQLLVLLATAALVASLFRKFNLELIPGYLLAGVLVGPNALGLVRDAEAVNQISELAIILLMFAIGLHLDTGGVKRGLVSILAVGFGSTVAVAAVGWGALVAFGVSAPAALVIGLALSMSSTAVVVRVLMARRETRSLHGRVTLGVSLVQDLVSVIVMAMIPPIARWAGVDFTALPAGAARNLPRWLEFVSAAGVSLGGITVLLLTGRVLLPRVLRAAATLGSSELMLVISIAVALGAAIGTRALGFSAEMGAFLGGLLLSSTPFRYQLAGQLAPLRDLLMAVFFTAVGMAVAPGVLVHHGWVILAGGVAIVLVKGLLIGGSAWLAGVPGPAAVRTGAYLASAGEFTLVVLAAAGEAGSQTKLLTGEVLSTAIGTVILSLILLPVIIVPVGAVAEAASRLPPPPWARRMVGARRSQSAVSMVAESKPPAPESADESPRDHIVIAGFGPVGRTLADRFEVNGVRCVVIELNPRTIERQTKLGRKVIYGDVTNPEVLESAGIDHARAVILTIPDDEATLRACQAIRAAAPEVFIAARMNFLSGKFIAHQLGADLITVEEVATAQAMEREVLAALARKAAAKPVAPVGDLPRA